METHGIGISTRRAETPYADGIRNYEEHESLRMYASNTLAQAGAPHVEGEHVPPDRVLADILSLVNTRMLTGGTLEYWIQDDGIVRPGYTGAGPGATAENAAPPEGNITETRHVITPSAWAWAFPQSILSMLAEPDSVARRMALSMAAMDEGYNRKILYDILGLGSGPGETDRDRPLHWHRQRLQERRREPGHPRHGHRQSPQNSVGRAGLCRIHPRPFQRSADSRGPGAPRLRRRPHHPSG